MGLEELPDGMDGMLFWYPSPRGASFTMRDTLIPLDIWWFDDDGVLIGSDEMEPCPETPCESYPSPGSISWALETEQGRFDFTLGDRLSTG